MLRNSGYFQSVTPKRPHARATVDKHLSVHRAWRNWVEQEGRRRQVALDTRTCAYTRDMHIVPSL